jgi:cytochrome P450
VPCPFSPDTPESTTTTATGSPSEAPIAIDPLGTDLHGEAACLAQRGPIARATLPGDVPVWVITSHEETQKLMSDPRVSKNWRNWNAFDLGLIPDDWPLLGMVQVTNMFTADGDDHKRLRGPVSRTFTARRVQDLAPKIDAITTGLLDALPGLADENGVVDLRSQYAFQLPMQVICEMFGVPEEWRPKLREVVQTTFDSTITPEIYLKTQEERIELLRKLVELHREEPGDDLTSALLATMENDPDALSDLELSDTLWLSSSAGTRPR